MDVLSLHLDAGSDVRLSLEALAREQGQPGFVLSVVGNLSAAVFQCPGKPAPTRLRGELEIITLSGTLSPDGVHLHLSFSDGDCRVWGGHLEPGTLVLRGADLLVSFLPLAGSVHAGAEAAPAEWETPEVDAVLPDPPAVALPATPPPAETEELRVQIAVLPGCPWSARALRMLRTLAIPHRVLSVENEAQRAEIQERSGSSSLPQVFIDGVSIGGYDALAESHSRHELEPLRRS